MIYAGDRGVGDVDSDSDGRSYGHCHDHACFQSNHDGCGHTSYLSQTPQTCLCKNILSGVNFSRLSEKNAYI